MEFTRRRLLAGLGSSAVTVSTVGCVGLGDDGGDDNQESDGEKTEDESDNEDSENSLTVYVENFATEKGTCTDGDDETSNASLTINDSGPDTVEFFGRIIAPNPCHVAVASADIVHEEDTKVVDVEIDVDETDADSCENCIGIISYSGVAYIEGGNADDVRINHIA